MHVYIVYIKNYKFKNEAGIQAISSETGDEQW